MTGCSGAFLVMESYDILYEPPTVVHDAIMTSSQAEMSLEEGITAKALWQVATQKNCFAVNGTELISQDFYPDTKLEGCKADCANDDACDYLVFNDRQNTCWKYSVQGSNTIDLSSSDVCRADDKYHTYVKSNKLCVGCDNA